MVAVTYIADGRREGGGQDASPQTETLGARASGFQPR